MELRLLVYNQRSSWASAFSGERRGRAEEECAEFALPGELCRPRTKRMLQ
jgi:hypothetical protein